MERLCPLWAVFKSSITLLFKKFLQLEWYVLYFTHCLLFSLDTTEHVVSRQSCSVFSTPNIRYLNLMISFFLSHLFSRLKKDVSSLSLSFHDSSSRPLIILMNLWWTESRMRVPFVLGSPEVHTALQGKSPQCWVEQRDILIHCLFMVGTHTVLLQ